MEMKKHERRRGHFPHLICGENRELSITPDKRLVFHDPREESAHLYLAGYSLCTDLLNLGRARASDPYEREEIGIDRTFEQIMGADEGFWEFRRMEIHAMLTAMPSTRESSLLYCHYINGDSIERIADRLGTSRRSAYRLYHRALISFSCFKARTDRSLV